MTPPPAPEPVPIAAAAPRRITLLRNAGHGANDLYWFILPPALPLILQEFGLRYAAGGAMIAVFLAMIALASMLTGRLSDRMHRGRLIGFGFLLASAALFAGSLMPILPVVVGFLVLGGIGVSTYHPAAYAAIHDSGHGNGRTYGTFEASGSIAIILMLAIQGLLVSRIGWRGEIMVSAVPGALMGLLLVLAPRLSRDDQRANNVDSPAADSAAPASRASGLLSALFLVGLMLRVLGVNALQNFVPTYLVRTVGMDPGLAAFAMGFTFLGGTAGAIVMGRAADRRGPFPVFVLSLGLLIPIMPVLGAHLPTVAYPALLVLIGFFSSACFPSQTMILGALSGARGKGSVFGVMMGATALTAAVSPLLFGLLADGIGLAAAVRSCAIPVAAAWLVTLFVWRKLSVPRR